MYKIGINKGIILRCTAYQISRITTLSPLHLIFKKILAKSTTTEDEICRENERIKKDNYGKRKYKICIAKFLSAYAEGIL